MEESVDNNYIENKAVGGKVTNEMGEAEDGVVKNRMGVAEDGEGRSMCEDEEVGNRMGEAEDGEVKNRMGEAECGEVKNRLDQGGEVKIRMGEGECGEVKNRMGEAECGEVKNRIGEAECREVKNRMGEAEGGEVKNRMGVAEGRKVKNRMDDAAGGKVSEVYIERDSNADTDNGVDSVDMEDEAEWMEEDGIHGERSDKDHDVELFIPPLPEQTLTIVVAADNHKNRFQEILVEQWKTGQFCDLRIEVKDGFIELHACVLFGFCPDMLAYLDSFCATPKMEMTLKDTNLTCAAVHIVIEYIYTGSLKLTANKTILYNVQEAAHFLKLENIESACRKHMSDIEEMFQMKDVEKGETNRVFTVGKAKQRRGRPKRNMKRKSRSKKVESHIEIVERNMKMASETSDTELTQIKSETNKISLPIAEVHEMISTRPRMRSDRKKSFNPIKTIIKQELEDPDFQQIEYRDNEFKCFHCHDVFDTFVEIESHLKTCSVVPAELTCDVCGLGFMRQSNLTQHKRRVHSDQYYLKCRDCGQQTKSEVELRNHCKTEHNELKPFSCDFPDCSYKAWRYDFVRRHKQIHQEMYDYTCENCGKAFSQLGGLISHHRTCYETQEYLCDVCGKAFNHLQSMQTHRRATHYKEKPYLCDKCNSSFSDHRNLKRHKRIHENTYPYCCEVCGKCYRHSNSLKAHMVKHTNRQEPKERTFQNLYPPIYISELEAATASLAHIIPHLKPTKSDDVIDTNELLENKYKEI